MTSLFEKLYQGEINQMVEHTPMIKDLVIITSEYITDTGKKLFFSFLSKLLGSTITACHLHPVQFKMKYRKFKEVDYTSPIEDFKEDFKEDFLEKVDNDFVNKLTDLFKTGQINWSTVINPSWTKLKVTSIDTGNGDSRGGGCGKLNLKLSDFVWEKERIGGLTVRDLTQAVYRMKGSKYDWWYELYSDTEFMFEDGILNMKVNFDYGS